MSKEEIMVLDAEQIEARKAELKVELEAEALELRRRKLLVRAKLNGGQ